jgi:hypothetical protein
VLVHSGRTERISKNLAGMMTGAAAIEPLSVDAYDIPAIISDLQGVVSPYDPKDLLFNLTGGTKTMALAAYHVAAKLRCRSLYLRSEGGRSLLYAYCFDDDGLAQLGPPEEIEETITIKDYFQVHGVAYAHKHSGKVNQFETAVCSALESFVGKGISQVERGISPGPFEIDAVIRCKNQVGIAEIKTGRDATGNKGINQLNTASEQKFFGSYTARFLIVDRHGSQNRDELAKAHNIEVIVLESTQNGGALSADDTQKLIAAIMRRLGGQR